MAKPIQRRLLIHSITVIKAVGDDVWGDPVGVEIEVNNVRVEPKSKVLSQGLDNQLVSGNLIFFDRYHTKGMDLTELTTEDKIIFNGDTKSIIQIDTLYNGSTNKIHHLEVYVQ